MTLLPLAALAAVLLFVAASLLGRHLSTQHRRQSRRMQMRDEISRHIRWQGEADHEMRSWHSQRYADPCKE